MDLFSFLLSSITQSLCRSPILRHFPFRGLRGISALSQYGLCSEVKLLSTGEQRRGFPSFAGISDSVFRKTFYSIPTTASDDFILPPPPLYSSCSTSFAGNSTIWLYFSADKPSLYHCLERETELKTPFGNLLLFFCVLPSPGRAPHAASLHSGSCPQRAFADCITFTNLKFLSSPQSSMHLGIKFL